MSATYWSDPRIDPAVARLFARMDAHLAGQPEPAPAPVIPWPPNRATLSPVVPLHVSVARRMFERIGGWFG